VLGKQLGGNAAPVSELDKAEKDKAFAPGCANLPGLGNIDRPGKAETKHHDCFK
jgi:hypothetical protein